MTALSSKLPQKIHVTERVSPRGNAESRDRALAPMRRGFSGHLETVR